MTVNLATLEAQKLEKRIEAVEQQVAGAADPDLLAALKKCVKVFEELADAGNYPLPLFQKGGWMFAVEAINKAESRSVASSKGD